MTAMAAGGRKKEIPHLQAAQDEAARAVPPRAGVDAILAIRAERLIDDEHGPSFQYARNPDAFSGIGFGYLMVEGLFEAMEHENLLSTAELWQDVQEAVAGFFQNDSERVNRHLRWRDRSSARTWRQSSRSRA